MEAILSKSWHGSAVATAAKAIMRTPWSRTAGSSSRVRRLDRKSSTKAINLRADASTDDSQNP